MILGLVALGAAAVILFAMVVVLVHNPLWGTVGLLLGIGWWALLANGIWQWLKSQSGPKRRR